MTIQYYVLGDVLLPIPNLDYLLLYEYPFYNHYRAYVYLFKRFYNITFYEVVWEQTNYPKFLLY